MMKTRGLRQVVLLLILTVFAGPASLGASSGTTNIPAWLAEFEDPPAWARPQMFFVWNGRLTTERISQMLRQYKREGIGGVFNHARPGLVTEYLSPEWFRMWRFTLDECKRLGLECHIYDENGFPSGFASGEVVAGNPNLAARYLTAVEVTGPQDRPKENVLAYFVVRKPDEQPHRVGVEAVRSASPEQPVWALVVRQMEPRKGHGGFPYPDVLHRETTDRFLRVTHEQYAARFEGDFGTNIKYVFTDEPDMPGKNGLPWSDHLLHEFRNEHGYDLRDKIEPLCFGGPGSTAVRFDYYQTITRLWIDNFVKPIYQWCEQHDLAFTGHLWEHEWPVPQKQPVVMHTYRWMQAPGTDLLGFHFFPTKFEDQLLAYLNQKELSSIGNQLGYDKLLCESSGAGGYGMSLRQFKPLEDFLLANGVNVMTPHLSYQTLAGARKYDWPQTISDHASWWDSYDLQANHVGRVAYTLTQGVEQNRLLVLHPDTSGWIHHQHENFLLGRKPEQNMLQQLKNSQCQFLGKLHGGQIDFDLGDELTMAELGCVEDGQLRIAKATYEAVIIPPGMDNWTTSTYQLVRDYLQSGGVVYTCAEPPMYVDGRRSTKSAELAGRYRHKWKEFSNADALVSAMRQAFSPYISRPDGSPLPAGLCWQRRVRADGSIVYFFCYPWEGSFEAEVELEGRSLVTLDTVKGKGTLIQTRNTEHRQAFVLELPAYGHCLLCVSPKEQSSVSAEPLSVEHEVRLTAKAVEREESNVVVLLFCDLDAGDTKAHGINTTLADEMNWKAHGCDGNIWSHSAQFRRTLIDKQFGPDSGFRVSYRFTIEPDAFDAVRDSLTAAVERPWLYRITLNGKELSFADGQQWFDPQIRRTSISHAVRPGANTLTLVAQPMRPLCEIMPVYVLGDFALQPNKSGFSIARPLDLQLGPWDEQGLPFYPGKITYRYEFSLDRKAGRIAVSLPDWEGSAARVRIDGRDSGVIAWPPDRLEIDKLLDAGDHELDVVVAGNLKNMMGPHFSDGLPGIWSWRWSGQRKQPPEKYNFAPCGLIKEPNLRIQP